MSLDSVHAHAPLGSTDTQPSQLFTNDRHQRQKPQPIDPPFVSTTVVPAPSPSDVLSSLISSLTVLSDSAREQLRSARELDQTVFYKSLESRFQEDQTAIDAQGSFDISAERDLQTLGISDGEEAEPPIVGYARPRTGEQKRPISREQWISHALLKEQPLNTTLAESNQVVTRVSPGPTSPVGIPSIQRARSESTSSLTPGQNNTRSPFKTFLASKTDTASQTTSYNSPKDPEVTSIKSTKSLKSFRAIRSRHIMKSGKHTESDHNDAAGVVNRERSMLSETSGREKHYSPLSPANREDLGDHMIPSRLSSKRHSPSRSRSRNKTSHSKKRSSGLPSKIESEEVSPISQLEDNASHDLDEEDSTLRRIRELQQAKEKRQYELQRESAKRERIGRRSSRDHTKSGLGGQAQEVVQVQQGNPEYRDHVPHKTTDVANSMEAELVSIPAIREIAVPSPILDVQPAMPSPALSTAAKQRRSLSISLRRSTSLQHGSTDDMKSVSDEVEAFLSSPRLTQRIRHPRTGRTVAFSEVGDPKGFTVFCCVGMGLTRFVTTFYDDVARTQRLRLITPDRPGIGESSPFPDNICAPLAWADDVAIICQTLNIEKFSLLAHSAGAIYALATALKMPDQIRCKIHLLAPWIPPSQFPNGNTNGEIKAANLPVAHKLLSVLPAPLLRAANSRFLSAASASIEPRSGRGRKKDQYDDLLAEMAADSAPPNISPVTADPTRHSSLSLYAHSTATPPPYTFNHGVVSPPASPSPTNMNRQYPISVSKFRSPTPNGGSISLTPQLKQALFNKQLTHRTWALATQNSNPAVDLLICLERRRPIGFSYADVTRSVVIYHGRKDTRVPLDNAQWLSKTMKDCELRVLNEEGHGLMASANVMSKVLSEIGREWEEWTVIADNDEKRRRDHEEELERLKDIERRRFIRQGH